jgi:hypothetical protein
MNEELCNADLHDPAWTTKLDLAQDKRVVLAVRSCEPHDPNEHLHS